MLQIYDTLTKTKKAFKPITPGKIGIYVCGMTVYDYCHIGHGRMFVVFDMVVRYLRFLGFDVTYVRNITDIDDKIINRARETGEAFTTINEKFIDAGHEDELALGVITPDYQPRATEYIPQIIRMIEKLIKNKHAYIADNGDVYFNVASFNTYGELAHQNLDDLRAGARVDVLEAKKNPLDFVLWKQAKPGEPKWPSPWNDGRPGWHIECSAMSTEILGKNVDIHGGGIDLVFPHHQNEIAQSEAANCCDFVNYWMHNGHVQINQEKMSKSLGNFFTIRAVLQQYDAEIVRYFMLASHYRSPINYAEDNLNSARDALERMYLCLRDLPTAAIPQDHPFKQKFIDAMNDDFNTPVALAVLFDLVREINKIRDENLPTASELGALLKELGYVLGVMQQDPEMFLRGGFGTDKTAKIESLIAERANARVAEDWAASDRIRDELLLMGVSLEDGPEGTIWRKAH